MKILVVDDSKAMRMIVKKTLRQAGYQEHETREAGDGQQALDVIREWEPDVVLSDWNMPNMNGPELLQALRADGFAGAFGFVTTECSPKMRQAAEEGGARFMITKPFTAQTFQETLGPFLG